jgi:pyruvate,orthophosphate dikinase
MSVLNSSDVLVLDGTTGRDASVLGGKAKGIELMRALGIPVPPACVLTTNVCRAYYANERALPEGVVEGLSAAVGELERVTGRKFGAAERPLLVSVRSGAPVSMPGMMDTILNLGMNEAVERALSDESGDPAFAADTRRRFTEQFTSTVGVAPPDDPWEQLWAAVVAVLESWTGRRAIDYRRERGISEDIGTAVTVQAMVFGNLDDRSGTGVLFTRDPLRGGSEPYGEWLPRGQGEDVVSGRHNARPLAELALDLPDVHEDLMARARELERDRRDVQDIEYTVESGRLWLLQSRAAKRSPEATIRHAVQLCREGLISESEALDRVLPEHVRWLLSRRVDATAAGSAEAVAGGKQACPGCAVGLVVTDVDDAMERADAGEDVVLARPTTDPDDVAAMSSAVAVLTELGGATSHAAVVCRELGVPCIVGCGEDTVTALTGQTVTVDATAGVAYAGALPIVEAREGDDPDLTLLRNWARAEAPGAGDSSLVELLRRRHGVAS